MFVVNGDHVEERIVTIGQTVDTLVEITNGLKAGERVATTNVAQLADGTSKVSDNHAMARRALRQTSGLRDRAHPVAHRHRRRSRSRGWASIAFRRSTSRPSLITTVQPGAAPEQIETEITDKIEEAVNTISGIDELRSISSEGVSQVIISFLLDKDTDVAAQEVRDKVNGVLPQLPKTIQQPRVDKFDPDAAPVLSLALSANKPVRDITEYADKVLRRQLESVNGVGQVLVLGGRQRQINVWLDADRLRAYNLTVTDVSRALQAQNIEIPGGRVDQGPQSLTLRTRGRVQTRRRVQRHRRPREGRPSGPDRATSRGSRTARPTPTRVANVNGTGTVLLQRPPAVGHQHRRSRQGGARSGSTSCSATLPPGYDVRIVRDQSEFIEASIHNVEEHLDRRLDSRRARRAAVPRRTCARRSSPRSRSRPRSSRRSA